MEESDEEELELESRIVSGEGKKETGAASSATSAAATSTATTTTTTTTTATAPTASATASEATNANDPVSAAARKAAEVAARINAMVGSSKATPQTTTTDDKKDEGNPVYAEEIVINDYPQKARWRVTNKVRKLKPKDYHHIDFSVIRFIGTNLSNHRSIWCSHYNTRHIFPTREATWSKRTQAILVY